MVKNKKLIIFLVMVLLSAVTVSFLLLRDNYAKPLKAGDIDPETGCIVTEGGGLICNGTTKVDAP